MTNNRRSVVYVVEDVKTAQFRYRVKNVVEALKKSAKWTGEIFTKSEIAKIDLGEVDILVILRQTAKNGEILQLIRRAQENGVKVLFDLDDLVFDYRDLRMVVETVQEKNLLYWMGYFWGVRRIARRVDGFLCTNDFLAEKLKQSFGRPVRVIRNSLSRDQVEVSGRLVKEKKTRRGDFVVGYFSGSPTHARDFGMMEEELVRFLKTHNEVILRVVGDMEFSCEMQGLISEGRVETSKKVDYLKLQEEMAKVDVNIAPLVINDFTNCKSELKFFEAAVVETTTIASPTYAFKQTIKDGENGYLAAINEWCDKLEYLYKHPQQNREVALVAKKYALENYYGKKFLKEVEEVYGYFAE